MRKVGYIYIYVRRCMWCSMLCAIVCMCMYAIPCDDCDQYVVGIAMYVCMYVCMYACMYVYTLYSNVHVHAGMNMLVLCVFEF